MLPRYIFLVLALAVATAEQDKTVDTEVDTDACLRDAKAAHPGNPNDELDAFLACVVSRLDSVEVADKEMLYLKTKLTEIENIPMFSPRALTHGLEKRQAGEEEEGRGWKNKDKKKKKKDKKRKKKKEKVFIKDIEDPSDAVEEDEVVAEAAAAVADPYTSGLQFSAYSSQPQPAYQPLPPPRAQQEYSPEPQPAREYSPGPQRAQQDYLASRQPAPEDRAQYLYGLDSQGNGQYMDEAAIEEVLQTPQALKAMMTYLVGSRSSGTPPSIPSRLQEHFQPRAQGRRQPPRQQEPRRPLQASRPLQARPLMQFFGPGDYVPELPHNVQAGVVKLLHGSARVRSEEEGPFQRLEPKPRRRREAKNKAREVPLWSKVMEKERRQDEKRQRNKNKAEKRNKEEPSKNQRRLDKCRACQDPDFAAQADKQELCQRCEKFSKRHCKHCSRKNYFNKHKEECRKCVNSGTTTTTTSTTTTTTSTTTTTTKATTTTTTTLSPARKDLAEAKLMRKKCREASFRKENREECKGSLDRCKSRFFRASNPDKCKAEKGDGAWLKRKCNSDKFPGANAKSRKICKELTDTDIATEKERQQDEFESLEDLVRKCDSASYRMANVDKCKVVESVDLFAQDDIKEDIPDTTVLETTPNEQVPPKPFVGDRSKSDILQTIPQMEETSEVMENEIEHKKDNIKADKIRKSDCNKPKYSAKNPEECGKAETKEMNKVLLKKCKKDKYRKKHNKRCQDLKAFVDDSVVTNESTNVEDFVLEDVRCRKDVFRKNYPDLCPANGHERYNLEEEKEDPDWLENKCKHKKFRLRNKDICQELCHKKKWAKLYKDICEGVTLPPKVTDEQNSIINSVIEDIKDIVSQETTKKATTTQATTYSTTTAEASTTTKTSTTPTATTTTRTTSTTTSSTTTSSTTTNTTTTTSTSTTTTTTTTTTSPTTTTTSTTPVTTSPTTAASTTPETTPQTTPSPSSLSENEDATESNS